MPSVGLQKEKTETLANISFRKQKTVILKFTFEILSKLLLPETILRFLKLKLKLVQGAHF
jgi:hypothetical protein